MKLDIDQLESSYGSLAEARIGDSVRRWLRAHGRTIRPRMTPQQVADMKLCFEMMDEDGSGAIDIDELSQAFKVRYSVMFVVSNVSLPKEGEGRAGRQVF